MFVGLIITRVARFAHEGEVMTTEKKSPALGWCIYGLGVIALDAVCLAFGDFHPGPA